MSRVFSIQLSITGLLFLSALSFPSHAALISTGDVSLTPPDIIIGQTSVGTFTIDAGSLQTNDNARVGDVAGSDGTVTVTGTGSTWTNNAELFVGSFGTGTLQIQSGGIVSSVTGKVGDQSTGVGDVSVDGAGSQWNNSNDLLIGSFGQGDLTVSSGGVVTAVNSRVGDQAGSQGTVIVSGSNSRLDNSQELFVGSEGTGGLSISAGGVVSNTNGKIADVAGSTGTVTVMGVGSRWENSADLFVSQGGDASLSIADGGVVDVTGAATVGALGELNLQGGDLLSTDLHLNGIVNLILGEGFTNNLTVDNSAFLGGTLAVTLMDGFVPVVGDEFQFLFASDILGSFDDILLPTFAGGQLDFFASNDGIGSLSVSAVPLPAGVWLLISALFMLFANSRFTKA